MSTLLREIVTSTLRASLLTVGAFLLVYSLIGLLSGGEFGPVDLGAYSGIVVFGLLLSLPFCLPIVISSVAMKVGYHRYARHLLQSDVLRMTIFLGVTTLFGFLQAYLWISVQDLSSLSTDIALPFYVSGAIGGFGCGYFGRNEGWG